MWEKKSNIKFNDKFKGKTFRNNKRETWNSTTTVKPIELKHQIKNYGNPLEGNLDFHHPAINTTAKGVFAWVMRMFRSRSKNVILILLKSLIILQVEYGWGMSSGYQSIKNKLTH